MMKRDGRIGWGSPESWDLRYLALAGQPRKLIALEGIAHTCGRGMDDPHRSADREFFRGVGAAAVWLGGGEFVTPVTGQDGMADEATVEAEHLAAGRLGMAGDDFATGVSMMLDWARGRREQPPVRAVA